MAAVASRAATRAEQIRKAMLAKQKARKNVRFQETIEPKQYPRVQMKQIQSLKRIAKPHIKPITKAQTRLKSSIDLDNFMGSSVIQFLDYYPERMVVQTRLGYSRRSTRNYFYTGVPPHVFEDWWEGKATCKTTDTSSLKRWEAGDSPSLGAFYNKYIKGKYPSTQGVYHT